MMKGSDIGIQEKKAKLFNEWKARAEGNATGHNGNQIRCYNCRGQASTSGTQTNKAPVYDSDGSAEYTELLEPIPESHQVPQNDNNVISEVTSVEQSGETVEQHPANVEETRALYDSLYQNLAIKVEKVNTVNHINKQLSKEKSTLSFLLEEKKRLKSDFKTRKGELLDKQIQLEKKIKELNNILVKTGYQNPFNLKQAQKKQQSLYDGKVLHEKHDPPVLHDLEETLQLAQESRQKIKQLNKEMKPANYTKINHLSGAKFVGDFKSLAKHKALELEIERLLRAVVSQDIMSVVQKASVVDTSNSKLSLNENTCGTSTNTKFAKQSILGKPPTLGDTHALSKPFTSNSTPTPQESKVVKNDKVITPGMFRINPFMTSREEKHVRNNVRASVRTKPITVLQPPVFTKKDVNSDSNGLSSTGIDNTKTRRP
nr:hypothetical protein [Tanacetum cinerariifolium]